MNAIPANIELTDTNLVAMSVIKKTTMHNKATAGWIAKAIPNKVATPFPPLNQAQMG